MNNNVIAEIPMATVANHTAYPTIESMTTDNTVPSQSMDQCDNNRNEDSGAPSSLLLRLRGGGCITDCLAALGCCFVCEECCC